MKAIIVPPGKNADYMGEGVYTLLAEDGECLCSHFCSHYGFAPGDLYAHRPERKEMFDAKGITEFLWLAESGFALDELVKRNHAWAAAKPEAGEEQAA